MLYPNFPILVLQVSGKQLQAQRECLMAAISLSTAEEWERQGLKMEQTKRFQSHSSLESQKLEREIKAANPVQTA